MYLAGFKVRRDNVGNVIGELGNDGPRILLCGHMDTVPGEIPVRIEGDTLIWPRLSRCKILSRRNDCGSSLAMERSSAPFRVTVAGVVEEEGSSEAQKP